MSDGECEEGTVWEAALFAAAQKLDRVAVIIDYNKWQATGRSDEVMALCPLGDKWRAFGWTVREVNGHDVAALVTAAGERARRLGPAAGHRRPHGQGQRRVVHGGRQQLALSHAQRPRNCRPRGRSWGWHEKRLRRHDHRTGRRRRPRRRPLRRHRQPAVRRFQGPAPGAVLQLRRGRRQHDGHGRRHGHVRAAAFHLHDHALRHHARHGADSHRRLLPQPAGDDRRHGQRAVLRLARPHAPFAGRRGLPPRNPEHDGRLPGRRGRSPRRLVRDPGNRRPRLSSPGQEGRADSPRRAAAAGHRPRNHRPTRAATSAC